MQSSEDIVEARERAFAASFANRDIEAFKGFVSSQAVFFMRETPIRGREAVAEAWAPLFENEQPPFSWYPSVIEVIDPDGLVFSSGPILNPAGEEVGRFNSVWRKESDGQWRVVLDKGS